jgi:hypothetical protein
MAGWGPQAVIGVCPSKDSSEADAATLLHVYTAVKLLPAHMLKHVTATHMTHKRTRTNLMAQAAGAWERHVGRKVLFVARDQGSLPQNVNYTIEVAFGEWNRKNGYTVCHQQMLRECKYIYMTYTFCLNLL